MEDEEEVKGIEAELIYEFAKSKNYNVDLVILINTEDRMKIGEKDTDFNIIGGHFTITEERAKTITFSNPIYTMKLDLFDNEYNKIPDNTAKLYSKVGNKTLTSFCAFPDIYDYIMTINCSINDFNGTDPFTQGIESTITEDKLFIMYSDLEINNILKANEKLKLPIIQESDKSEHICSEENRVKESNTSSLIPASSDHIHSQISQAHPERECLLSPPPRPWRAADRQPGGRSCSPPEGFPDCCPERDRYWRASAPRLPGTRRRSAPRPRRPRGCG